MWNVANENIQVLPFYSLYNIVSNFFTYRYATV